MLNEQRRMIPVIRKLLTIEPEPFYKGLRDHPSVLDRPKIPGMRKNLWFFNHRWPEARNQDMSMVNVDVRSNTSSWCLVLIITQEAEMTARFFLYLKLNGTPIEKITVLSVSFGNGLFFPTTNSYTVL